MVSSHKELPDGVFYNRLQERGARAIQEAIEAKRKHGFLLADGMGAGKTIQAMLAMNRTSKFFERIVIICSASLTNMWYDELKRWDFDKKFYFSNILHPVIKKKEYENSRLIICTYGILSNQKFYRKIRDWLDQSNRKNLLVLDEMHKVKSAGNNQAKVAKNIFHRIRGIARSKNHVQRNFVLGLSGTPLPNGLNSEIFNFIRHAVSGSEDWNKEWDSFAKYAEHFCKFKEYQVAHAISKSNPHGIVKKEVGGKNREDLKKVLRLVSLRRKSSVINKSLPQRMPIKINYLNEPYDNKMAKSKWDELVPYQYNKLKGEKLIEAIETVLARNKKLSGQLAEHVRIIGMLKIDWVCDYVSHLIEEGGREEAPVLFCNHLDVVTNITEILYSRNLKVGGFTGKHLPKDRAKEMKEFEAGNQDVFITTIDAGGEGVNLQFSRRPIIVEMDWRPTIIEQAICRCHRTGQKRPVFPEYVVIKKSIDDIMLRMCKQKDRRIDLTINELEPRVDAKVVAIRKVSEQKKYKRRMGLYTQKWQKEIFNMLYRGEPHARIMAINSSDYKQRWMRKNIPELFEND